jgi:hypothetical protein
MTRDQFLDKQFSISVTSGMNQRYHQSVAHWWTGWNRAVQITVAILAAIGAILACVAPFAKSTALDVVSAVFACLAAIVAIALNVLPLGDWSQEHLDLLRRWSDLREDADSLLFDLTDDEPPPHLIARLKSLDAKVHRICGGEPLSDKALLEQCYREENRSRQQPQVAGEPQAMAIPQSGCGVPG